MYFLVLFFLWTNCQEYTVIRAPVLVSSVFIFERRSSPAAYLHAAVPVQNYVALAILAVLPSKVGQVAGP